MMIADKAPHDRSVLFWNKMAITALLVYQIEKFQCPELSTAKDLSPGTFQTHMDCVMCPKTEFKVSQLFGVVNIKSLHYKISKITFLGSRVSD